ncbi:DMT family transporter [Parashewanella curva]|uniref:DMT family transporter n=1 Tax=Parashewanella curva TaxID=2338552 RepID=A0A3L8PWV9_9GAMM|nr:DMT family transporter [Parashewanella curva]RLV59835.1 DMT family transporter [Parashewanella curva]
MESNQLRFSILTLGAGGLLALMIFFNSQLAFTYSPIEASWFAHGVGGFTALILMLFIQRKSNSATSMEKAPFIAYLGGIPGAFTVLLAGYTVNSYLGLSGTLALAIIGQIIFSLVSDGFGLFGLSKKKIGLRDFASLLLITGGSLLIILASGDTL